MKDTNPEMANNAESKASDDITFEEQEFNNWCDANEIDRGIEGMNDDDSANFKRIKKHFTAAVKEKRLVVDGENINYTVSEKSPNKGEAFIIRPPNGRAMLAMDGFKETAQQQRLQNFMAAICGVEKRDISKIAGLNKKDYAVIRDIATLFLAD